MWNVISKISKKQKKSAVILTTHSMEEVEALSDKIGIMVKGGLFKCFGSTQHIKDKFGTGYEIEIKVKKMVNSEILQDIQTYGIPKEKEFITFQEMQFHMRENKVNEFLVNEIREGGLGNDLFKEALNAKGLVSVKNFIVWLNTEIKG